MSVTYGFYNSLNHDRQYNAEQMGSIFDGIIKDGIFDSIGNMFMVTAGTGMQVNIGTGKGWCKGTWTINDAVYPITINPSHAVLNRIDAVVWEIDKSERINSFKIVQGTNSSSPEPPKLLDDDINRIYQYPLAYISVKAGVEEIKDEDISNKVGMEECPFVTGVLETADISALYLKWEAQFYSWFNRMKDQLSTDAAGHLQNEIDLIHEMYEGVLHAGEETLTIEGSRITTNCTLSFFTSIYGVSPTEVSVRNGAVTLTFDIQDSDMKVGVKIE